MRIGILSDTHTGRPLDAMGPAIPEFLSSADLIVHTGDVTHPNVLDWLETFGPLVCVRGNHDLFTDDRLLDVTHIVESGWKIGLTHIALDFRDDPNRIERMREFAYGGQDLDILIAGDTHYERIEYAQHTLLLNSGSLLLPHNMSLRLGGVAVLEIQQARVHAEVRPLGETEGLPNPTDVASIDITREGVVAASYRGQPLEIVDGEVNWPGPAPRDQM